MVDPIQDGSDRVIEQMRKPRLLGWVLSFLEELKALEDAIEEVIVKRMLDNAEGVQLDIIGKIVAREREGLSDGDYRLAIRTQIKINNSDGTGPDLIDIARLSMPDGVTFHYSELFPMTVQLNIPSAGGVNLPLLLRNLSAARQGAVKLFLTYTAAPPGESFTFAPGAFPVDDNSGGFDVGLMADILEG